MRDPVLLAFTIAITVGSYAVSRRVFLRSGNALLNPVFLSTSTIIAILLVLGLGAEQYASGKEVMTSLLGPATVALALPLYRNRHLLIERLPAVLLGIISGSISTIATGVILARAGALEKTIVLSLAPKSVTAPIAIEIADIIGGDPALTAAFVIATGILGSIIGPAVLSMVRVHDPVARGLAMGTTSHGQGTAIILAEGETQGAMSGVAMALAAIFTSFIAPLLIPWLVTVAG